MDKQKYLFIMGCVAMLGVSIWLLFKFMPRQTNTATMQGYDLLQQQKILKNNALTTHGTSIPKNKAIVDNNEMQMIRERCRSQCRTSVNNDENDECIQKCVYEVEQIYNGNQDPTVVQGKGKCNTAVDQRSCNQQCFHLIKNQVGYRSCQTACQLQSLRYTFKCLGFEDRLYEMDKIGM